MSPAFRSAMHAVDVISEVRARLEAEGGIRELLSLSRFSVDELDLLVQQETGVAA